MANPMLHIVIINYSYAADCSTADQLLAQTDFLTEWAEEVQGPGVKVTVFQRFVHKAVIHRANVTYHLIADNFGPGLRTWQLARQLNWSAYVLCAASVQARYTTLVQVNSFDFPTQTWHLRSLLPPACPLVVQYCGTQPWPAAWRSLQRWGLRKIDGFLFTQTKLAQPWIDQRIIRSPKLVYEVMEDAPGRRAVAVYETILQERSA